MRLSRASNPFALAVGTALACGFVACTSKYTDEDFGLVKEDGTGGTETGGTGAGGTGGAGDGGTGAGMGMGGMGGGSPSIPTRGLVVVGGVDTDNQSVLSVLDPESGEELSRDAFPSGVQVAAIAHDGAPDRDLWFVFTAGTFPATASVPANLQVRRFDDAEETWTTLGTVTNLPPPLPGSLTVLNERLAYVSYEVEGGEVVQSVTLLDTEDPGNVEQISFEFPTSGESDNESLIGLAGVRGTEEDTSLPGGTLNLVIGVGATMTGGFAQCGDSCDVHIQSIAVGNLIQEGLRGVLGEGTSTPATGTTGVPIVTVDPARRDVLVAVPAADSSNNVNLYRVPDPRDTSTAEFGSLPLVSESVAGFAVAECADVLAFTLPVGTLNGVSRAGIKSSVDLERAGQLLVYEPYTRSLIAPFNPEDASAPEILAFETATNSSGTSITVTPRSDWSAPADLRVDVLAVRYPDLSSCE